LWECPDLIALPVDGAQHEIRWVLKVDFCHGDDDRGCSGHVFFGQFDGENFIPDCDENGVPCWQRLDEGPDFYAAMSWHGAPAGDARRIWIGWMNNHSYSSETPTGRWRGMMSAPRSLGLRRIAPGSPAVALTQNIVAEYAKALGPAVQWDGAPMHIGQRAARIDGALIADGTGDTGFALCWGNAARIEFRLNREKSLISLDRRQSGAMVEHPVFARIATAQRISGDLHLPFYIILDHCSVEIFIDGGLQVFSAQVFPPEGTVRIAPLLA
jgi:sucrose-6-phosphate hydrolase SacC (GH32 family)